MQWQSIILEFLTFFDYSNYCAGQIKFDYSGQTVSYGLSLPKILMPPSKYAPM
jgi:hypothetical protein